MVRGGPEVRFHEGSTKNPRGLHQGSTRVPPGFHQGSTRVPPGFHEGSTRVPRGLHEVLRGGASTKESTACCSMLLGISPELIVFLGGKGSPTKIDCRKKGTLILTSLLEDLGKVREP